jgi:hypothetical protein
MSLNPVQTNVEARCCLKSKRKQGLEVQFKHCRMLAKHVQALGPIPELTKDRGRRRKIDLCLKNFKRAS